MALKKLASFEPQDVVNAFKHPQLKVINDVNDLESKWKEVDLTNKNGVLMSSANFGGLNITKLF